MEALISFSIPIGKYHLDISQAIIVQWCIMAVLIAVFVYLGKGLKRIPNRKQTISEILYTTIRNLVRSNIGEEYDCYIPVFGTMAIFLLAMNFIGIIGITPPTKDYSIALGMALCAVSVIHINAIKKMGFGHYLLGYGKPFIFMLPINIMERVMFPVSLSLRLCGNMIAATMILEMIYGAMGNFALILPIPIHLYFDIFDGGLQMIVFLVLTMIQTKILAEH